MVPLNLETRTVKTAKPLPFDEFVARVVRIYSTGRHAKSTLSRMKMVLDQLRQLGAGTTRDLTSDLIARWIESRGPGANPNTINGYLSSIAAACAYAVEEGWLERSPNWSRLRLRPAVMTKNRPPSYDQVVSLLDHLRRESGASWSSRRLHVLTLTIAMTAVRLREAIFARVEDLDLGTSPTFAVVPRRRLKTERSARVIPLPELLAEVLRSWVREVHSEWLFPGVRRLGPWAGGPLGNRSLDALQAAAEEVGIARITWHSLRHAFGTAALTRWGIALWIVRDVMGHTDERTTRAYTHTAGSPAIAEALRGIAWRQAC